jgi:hypothetical protein
MKGAGEIWRNLSSSGKGNGLEVRKGEGAGPSEGKRKKKQEGRKGAPLGPEDSHIARQLLN